MQTPNNEGQRVWSATPDQWFGSVGTGGQACLACRLQATAPLADSSDRCLLNAGQ